MLEIQKCSWVELGQQAEVTDEKYRDFVFGNDGGGCTSK